MEPFKNIFNPEFYSGFCKQIGRIYPAFKSEAFTKAIFTKEWGDLELKERVRHTTHVLNGFLTNDYKKDLELLIRVAKPLIENRNTTDGLAYLFIPDYIEVYGKGEVDFSLKAMETITQLCSCEFAIRPFIANNPDKVIPVLYQWAKSENEHIRRLASEGSRPRLPWGMALSAFKKDPSPVLPLLNELKNDTSLYVRRSVANNLNDISKDHPALVITTAQDWIGENAEIDWVVKHGCRTLLKAGNLEVMKLFGYGSIEQIVVKNFKILNENVTLGEYLNFEFEIENGNKQKTKIRLEYAVYFMKKNGELSKKVFKISEKEYEPNSSLVIKRRQHFKPITTRVYYAGLHQIALIINGIEQEKHSFYLSL